MGGGAAPDLTAGNFSDIFGCVRRYLWWRRGRGGRSSVQALAVNLRYHPSSDLEEGGAPPRWTIRVPTLVEMRHCDGPARKKGAAPSTGTTVGARAGALSAGLFPTADLLPRCHGTRQDDYRSVQRTVMVMAGGRAERLCRSGPAGVEPATAFSSGRGKVKPVLHVARRGGSLCGGVGARAQDIPACGKTCSVEVPIKLAMQAGGSWKCQTGSTAA